MAQSAGMAGHVLRALLLALACHNAYEIRMHAVRTYGPVIHEFDPWFNYRATEYLAANGLHKFFTWFDHMSWYPLGRPVGTTIYPGMQITSVCLWRTLGFFGSDMSLNDVCVYVPVWFGVMATILLGLLTYEVSKSANAAVASTLIMAVVPAHLMRSVGGGYDNESVAVTAMCLVFLLWCRSLRNGDSWPLGAAAGLAYVNMAAAWGGFVFVGNLVALHALVLVLVGRYDRKLHRVYSLFFVVGTLGATRVPVVGYGPLRSLEQLAPLLVFGGLQVLYVGERYVGTGLGKPDAWNRRLKVYAVSAGAGLLVLTALFSVGYFGPISSRVRGLFVKHTRTGNPLVDSVAEHQPASANAYWHYLHTTCYAAPAGLLALFGRRSRVDARAFLAVYAVVSYFFSSKMVRLIIFLGPVASALAGIALGAAVDATAPSLLEALLGPAEDEEPETKKKKLPAKEPARRVQSRGAAAALAARRGQPRRKSSQMNAGGIITALLESGEEFVAGLTDMQAKAVAPLRTAFKAPGLKVVRTVLAAALIAASIHYYKQFSDYAWSLSEGMSQPSIMFRAHLRNGQPVIVDDYREAYWWLRDNTREDARVLAWWDYGYQIAGLANRTTLADGNTWNHEHIATIGRCLTSPEKQAHKIVRHLADYVLVWTGGGGDDLAKSPHMARIGNSVYRDICPDDPTCRSFGFTDRQGTPTPMMAESLLYKLHSHQQRPGVSADPLLFREAYTSRFNKVRIFKVLKVSKTSKQWTRDPANRLCDAPGSWYCVGQYPPALQELISRRIDFAQLEDFNKKQDGDADAYVAQYMARMEGRAATRGRYEAPKYFEVAAVEDDYDEEEEEAPLDAEALALASDENEARARATVEAQREEWARWANSEDTTLMWQVISSGEVTELGAWVARAPGIVHLRAEDGRGPLWWAWEYDRPDMVELLVDAGADPEATDSLGMAPREMAA
jgi:dolichyl-diphosphooligosaccharide--protein glycosyltransferase